MSAELPTRLASHHLGNTFTNYAQVRNDSVAEVRRLIVRAGDFHPAS